MGYLPYDVNLKTIFWVFVLIYLGLIIIFFVRKSLQTEIKTQKSVFRALAIFFSLYIITRIFFIIYDYERDLNGNTLAAFRYLAIAYAFFILAFLDFIYLTEKYVINRSKYIITYIFLIAFIINVIMIFFPELMPLIRYINYGLLYSEAAIILIIYLYLVINTTGEMRKKSLLIIIGLLICIIAEFLDTEALLMSGLVLPFYSPILFAIGATVFTYAHRKS